MNLEFDPQNVSVAEFGVGRDDGNRERFVAMPVGADVQAVLQEMVQATWDAMQNDGEQPRKYEPSEKHASMESLYLPLEDELAASVRALHEASTLEIDSAALHDPSLVFAYFARFTDQKGRRLLALRRATQFKGILKKRNRLVRMVDDTLTIIDDTVFKLDNDFDLLVDGENVYILRPSGFEFAGRLQQAILDAVPQNIEKIAQAVDFVEFESIASYASTRPRAARYLASIRGQAGGSIDKDLLGKLCKQTGVEINESNGRVSITTGHELAFLEVLDRRRYEVSLVKDEPELYRAASRRKLQR